MQDHIVIKGAREHNLKDINIEIPRDKLIVVTGPSGSGKSSLAIDTIYAEGQRRYIETLSAYARQFLGEMQKPNLDSIDGLSPSIAIEQKTISKSPRSTLGTLTEIYDYLRVLYTRIGKPYCHKCSKPIKSQNTNAIIDTVISLPEGTRLQVLSPIVKERKGQYRKELLSMRREGFVRARIDGRMIDLTEDIELNKYKRHTIEIVIDRLIIKPGIERKLKIAIDLALQFNSTVIINLIDKAKDIMISKTMACADCGINIPDLTPMFFSFNSKLGACPKCEGLGYENLSEYDQNIYENLVKCNECNGLRLRKEALSIKINKINIGELSRLSIENVHEFLTSLKLNERDIVISTRILREITDRLIFLKKVGIGYLALDRLASSLSGGEAQRMRLATQIGTSLSGVLYILDEPSIGLHPRDCNRLIDSLKELRNNGNTIIVVEHDEETILSSDIIIDMGPDAGEKGGQIVAKGTPLEIKFDEKSLTGKFLSHELKINPPLRRRQSTDFIVITKASEHNLKDITLKLPLNAFITITGVSGSGKSTLILDTLYRALMNRLYDSNMKEGKYSKILGSEKINKVICVDQSPIGKTPRSNPATYIGILNIIRELFAAHLDSRTRGYTPSRFSFNIKGGRCEVCQGAGFKKYEMHFLPAAFMPCDQCNGKRFNQETLEIKYKGNTIADVLKMTINEAKNFFLPIPQLRYKLDILEEVGLGYIQLGQPANTLSGGEAQRLRLSRELVKKTQGRTLYILDEPTTGLHFIDIDRLLKIINRLVDKDNTVVVIEHNLDVIKSSDYIIDLGPEGGDNGGFIVAEGTPEEIIKNENSYTVKYLKKKLGNYSGMKGLI